jgi:CubicO group peptidase (beta-lactamase class C family)
MKNIFLHTLLTGFFLVLGFSCNDDDKPEDNYQVPVWGKTFYPGAEWSFAEPTKYGYKKNTAEVLDACLENNPVTGVIIIVGGESIYSYGETDELSYLASARKSIMSMMYGKYVANGTIDLGKTIGQLIDAGVINDDVGGLSEVEKQATIKDCIAARSGCYHQGSNSGDDYAIAPERDSQTPGHYFLYNNWDFNVSGSIFEGLTGRNVYDVLEKDIALPIGMQDWDRSKQIKGGSSSISIYPACHFYLSARDMARLGYLMLRNGKWNNTQLLPAAWCNESTTAYTPVDRMNPVTRRAQSFGYGYMWWIWDGPANRGAFKDAYMAMGAGGQYIAVLPALDMVVSQKRDTNILTDSYSQDIFIQFLMTVAAQQIKVNYLN